MAPKPLFDYPRYWAECFGPAPMLPMSRAEMDALGWDACDIIIVTGDAYIDHPSFGMAIMGRLLEAQGFRVGIISQPQWRSAEAFTALGEPTLFFGVTAGNMDSMINRYTADRKRRNDDAYTPGGEGGARPDRSTIVYCQRLREAYPHVPQVIGGIEASLRRTAHYDYWQDEVRRSILADAQADLLVFGNAERAIVEIAHRMSRGASTEDMRDIRGIGFLVDDILDGWQVIDSSGVDKPGRLEAPINPYETPQDGPACQPAAQAEDIQPIIFHDKDALRAQRLSQRAHQVVRLPPFQVVRNNPMLYAHANRVLHQETNPHNARALYQSQGEGRKLWLNPPAFPLSTEEMDYLFDLPYARRPHPLYADANIPAWEMIRFSVNIMRGCFGGCTFCSITEHEGRIIQSRSEDSIIREIEAIRDQVKGFTGVISDLGGPTANMYRLACRSRSIEAACRKPSCVYPGICPNLDTDHSALVGLYRRARALPGIKRILISSGLRYDLAVESPEYVKELVTHHVGGYLKIAPEHTEQGPLDKMMKPGMGTYRRFRELFDQFSAEAGKEQYLIPYFIAAHPGTTDEDMMNLALWLKRNGFRADQVQNFYPSPMSTATAMYHSGKNPLKRIGKDSEAVAVARSPEQRKLHKAFLRYHDPANWPLLRQALTDLGRTDLIGSGDHQLIPAHQPKGQRPYQSPRRKNSSDGRRGRTSKGSSAPQAGLIRTQHTGLPPLADSGSGRGSKAASGTRKRNRKH